MKVWDNFDHLAKFCMQLGISCEPCPAPRSDNAVAWTKRSMRSASTKLALQKSIHSHSAIFPFTFPLFDV